MPFAAGNDAESQSLADGLTEDVTAGLARFPIPVRGRGALGAAAQGIDR